MHELRKLINLVEMPDRQRNKEKTKSRTAHADPDEKFTIDVAPTDVKFSDPTSKGEVSSSRKSSDVGELPGKTRSAQNSRAQASQADLPRGAGGVMRDFMNRTTNITDPVHVDEPVDYDIGVPEPRPPGQEVTTIGTALADLEDVEINWHELRHLPGYAIQQIRGAFRPLFNEFFNAELEDIKVVTTLDGSIDKQDLRAFMGFLSARGEKYDDFDLEAFGIDRNTYHVEKAYLYHFSGYNFLLMQENLMGQRNWYIYTAPGYPPDKSELTGGQEDLKQIGN